MSEIRMMSFAFAPKGWAFCNGQLLPIQQNQALFSLLGTSFGGNGTTNFGLPDLRGRVPIHVGNGHTLGERAGTQTHTLSIAEMPTHSHVMQGSTNNGDTVTPAGNVIGSVGNLFNNGSNLTSLSASAVANVGGSQGHENMQPYLAINFCIALQGIYPSSN